MFFVLGTLAVVWIGGNTRGISSLGTLDFTEGGIIQNLIEIVSTGNPDLSVDVELVTGLTGVAGLITISIVVLVIDIGDKAFVKNYQLVKGTYVLNPFIWVF